MARGQRSRKIQKTHVGIQMHTCTSAPVLQTMPNYKLAAIITDIYHAKKALMIVKWSNRLNNS
jgi:hypothetical protein